MIKTGIIYKIFKYIYKHTVHVSAVYILYTGTSFEIIGKLTEVSMLYMKSVTWYAY